MFKQHVRNLKMQYGLFWLLPVLLATAYETDFFPVGLYADDPQMRYVWETAGILTAIVCVPLSLILFSVALKKKIDKAHLSEALPNYVFWSGVRLGLLEIAALSSVSVYYLTLSNTGAFCALIALTASVFCLPGEKRMREELNVTNGD
jgi:hypothetical protein